MLLHGDVDVGCSKMLGHLRLLSPKFAGSLRELPGAWHKQTSSGANGGWLNPARQATGVTGIGCGRRELSKEGAGEEVPGMPQASPGCSGGPTTFPAAEALLSPRSYQHSCKHHREL